MSEFDCPIPCFMCGKKLTEVYQEGANQANDANAFISHGQYGSTVFDPLNGYFLEINICDECIIAGSKKNRVLLGRNRRPVVVGRLHVGSERVERPYKIWNRDDDMDEDPLSLTDVDQVDTLPATVTLQVGPDFVKAELEARNNERN